MRWRTVPSIGSMVWVAVWTFPLLDPLSRIPGPVSGTALALFWALYVYTMALGFHSGDLTARKHVLFALVAALGLGLAATQDPHWLIVLLYVSCCGVAVYGGQARPVVAAGIFAGSVAALLTIGLLRHPQWETLGTTVISTVLASLLVGVVRQLFRVVAELEATRDALAVAAVADERLRFARDLHDLLGHTLSVIVVKAEVVRRLAERDPAAAAAQAADIEQIGRRALVEIREAVTGYREAGLTAELTRAKGALAGAGIAADVLRTADPLPEEADRLLAWVVREASTNVLRHSHAGRCEIAVTTDGGVAQVSVTDDGDFPESAAAPTPGNGLSGLTERLRAAGGTLSTGPRPGGGFALKARLPL